MTTRIALLLALALAACGGGAHSPAAAPTEDDPTGWLGGVPNAWGTVRLAALRADPDVLACAPRPASARALAELPCLEPLVAADRVDGWLRRSPSDAPSTLLVFRGADAEACLAAESPARPVGPGAVEHVRTGTRWPRAFVVGTGKQTTVLFATGAAIEPTRRALAAGTAPPRAPAVKALVHAGLTAEFLDVLLAETQPGAELPGFRSLDLVVDGATDGAYAGRMRVAFATKEDADRAAPLAARLPGKHVTTVARTDQTTYDATVTVARCRP